MTTAPHYSDTRERGPGSALRRVISAAEARGCKRKGHLWTCPVASHPDSTASASFTEKGGRANVHCFGPCEDDEVRRALGLEITDLYDEPKHQGGARAKRRPADGAGSGDQAEKRPPEVEVLGPPTPAQVSWLMADRRITKPETLERVGAKHVRARFWNQDTGGFWPWSEYLALPSIAGEWKLWRRGVEKLARFNTGKGSLLFSPDLLARNGEGVLRVLDLEGESDAIAAIDSGTVAVIASTVGAGTLTGHDRHAERLLSLGIGEVIVIRDRDRAGREGAAKAAKWWSSRGIPVRMLELPAELGEGGDVRDFLLGRAAKGDRPAQEPLGGPADLDALADAAQLIEPRAAGDEASESETEADRPIIQLTDRQLDAVVGDAVEALRGANDPPATFLRGGVLVTIRPAERGGAVIVEATDTVLVEQLARAAYWRKGKRASGPTRDLAGHLAARLLRSPELLPTLVGVTESPLLRADGSIIDHAGYDDSSGLYYAPRAGFTLAPIPERPSAPDVLAALGVIDDALGEFPFATPADRAAALASVLTVACRELISGCAPAFLFDAPAPGTGKGLLADLVTTLSAGGAAAKMAEPDGRSDDEARKRITALLLEGRPVVVLDNVERPLGSASLAAVLTAEVWSDRLLGRSQNVRLPNRAVWLVTGNNLRLRGDLPRRCVWCRLDAKLARPWAREGFRHPDLLAWVREHRGELLGSVFTLARAWIAAGRPAPAVDVPPLGGFEAWRAVVGGILNVAGVPGFLGNLAELYDVADDDVNAWAGFLLAWRARWPSDPIAVATLLGEVSREGSALADALPLELAEAAKKSSAAKRIGKALARRVETRFVIGDAGETLRIVRELDSHSKSVRWGVRG